MVTPPAPVLSVIIPTCDRKEALVRCLDALKVAIQNAHGSIEVIVADDGKTSSSQTLIAANYSWVKYVPGPRKGPAANRNKGASTAIGKWLLFIDDDCIPDKFLLISYEKALDGINNVLEGRTSPIGHRTRIDLDGPFNETGGFLWSCNMAIRKDLFSAIGGFDESFPYAAMEDIDLRTRLEKASESYIFISDACVYHPWTPFKGLTYSKRHAESLVYFVSKHPEQKKCISWPFLLWTVLRTLIKVLPLDVLQNGVAGLNNRIAQTLYYPFAIQSAKNAFRRSSTAKIHPAF